MPKLWNETIEAHRHQVRDAILDGTAELVAEHGRRSVTMSQIAQRAGIGRATLYKYFPDIEAILHAWHARQIAAHLHQLMEVRDQATDPGQRLEAVLTAYALITRQARGHQDVELVAFLHQDEQVAGAQRQLHQLVRELITDAAAAGQARGDVPAGELASYCLHALGAAAGLPSQAAARRLVQLTLAGLRPRLRCPPAPPRPDRAAGADPPANDPFGQRDAEPPLAAMAYPTGAVDLGAIPDQFKGRAA